MVSGFFKEDGGVLLPSVVLTVIADPGSSDTDPPFDGPGLQAGEAVYKCCSSSYKRLLNNTEQSYQNCHETCLNIHQVIIVLLQVMKDVPSVICMCQYGTCIATVNLRILQFAYCKCKICVLCRARSPEKNLFCFSGERA